MCHFNLIIMQTCGFNDFRFKLDWVLRVEIFFDGILSYQLNFYTEIVGSGVSKMLIGIMGLSFINFKNTWLL